MTQNGSQGRRLERGEKTFLREEEEKKLDK